MIRHFKGSRAIGFWSHFMFGLERDQQAENVAVKTTTVFRVLKDRYTGRATGELFWLGYDRETGLLYEADNPEKQDNPFPTDEAPAEGPSDF
jgi:twinkle protein